MIRQIVLDTETTGLSPAQGHRVIEIGCVELVNRKLTGNHFHYYINPERDIDAGAEQVHGISSKFLQDKPLFKDIVAEMLEYLGDAELIIHNAPFDLGFLNHELNLFDKKIPTLETHCKIIDTLVMARRKHAGQRNSLDALCTRYHIDNSNRQLHGALLDSEILAQVYLAMTGGQTTMFGGQAAAVERQQETVTEVQRLQEAREALRVIKPTQDELHEHERYMEMLREQAS